MDMHVNIIKQDSELLLKYTIYHLPFRQVPLASFTLWLTRFLTH